jgi:uncharacterized membrane protein YkgB
VLFFAAYTAMQVSKEASDAMYSVFYIIGVIVAILAVLSLVGIRWRHHPHSSKLNRR